MSHRIRLVQISINTQAVRIKTPTVLNQYSQPEHTTKSGVPKITLCEFQNVHNNISSYTPWGSLWAIPPGPKKNGGAKFEF